LAFYLYEPRAEFPPRDWHNKCTSGFNCERAENNLDRLPQMREINFLKIANMGQVCLETEVIERECYRNIITSFVAEKLKVLIRIPP